jgi:aspartate 1-decarboxylase
MRCWVAAKIHGVRVTGASVAYHGSVTVDGALLAAAGIEPYEQAHVVNLATGHRWVTYAVSGEPGAFTLNGGGARLGAVGDECVLLAYVWGTSYQAATVVFVDERNAQTEMVTYQ